MIRTKFFSQTSTHLARFRNIGWVKSQHGSRKFTTRVTQNICCIIGRAKAEHDSHEISIPNINPPSTSLQYRLVKSQEGSLKFTTRVTQNICCITGRAKSQHDSRKILITNINPPRPSSQHRLGEVKKWIA